MDDNDAFDRSILKLIENSLIGVESALQNIASTREAGDFELVHAKQQILVRMLCLQCKYLELAEDMAQELVREHPTRTNLEVLSEILLKREKPQEASLFAAQALETAPSSEEAADRKLVQEMLQRRLLPDAPDDR